MNNLSKIHNKNIISEKNTNKMRVVPGSIIRFTYSGKEVTDSRPLVLVLNPRWRGKLHGLNLNYLKEPILKRLWTMVQETVQGKIERLIKLRLPLLKPDIGNPYSFYHTRLKRFLKGRPNTNAYRTYNYKNVGGVRVIDYKFKDASWAKKKYGRQLRSKG